MEMIGILLKVLLKQFQKKMNNLNKKYPPLTNENYVRKVVGIEEQNKAIIEHNKKVAELQEIKWADIFTIIVIGIGAIYLGFHIIKLLI